MADSLQREALRDRLKPRSDAAGVVLPVPLIDHQSPTLSYRPPRHAVLAFKLPHGHAVAVVTPDRRVQLDLRHLRHDQQPFTKSIPMLPWQEI
ncbi:hypothetical protein AB0L49_46570 [Streptomyces antimycoticus]|uniref:hypothetical protein n=1 Tax=Streptomyces antimycoticus TaxID=68175 RepID=UPI00344372B0